MKLYIDNQYTPGFIRIVTALHSMQFNPTYEIVSGQWDNEFKPANTVVFLWDTNKKGLSQQIIKHYIDGYKVFTYKKPFGSPLDLFKVSLVMLSQWKKMLETIEKEEGPFLFTINDSKKILKRVMPN
jgi:hypothetical protein